MCVQYTIDRGSVRLKQYRNNHIWKTKQIGDCKNVIALYGERNNTYMLIM